MYKWLNCTPEIPDPFRQHSQLTAWYCPSCPLILAGLKVIKIDLMCLSHHFVLLGKVRLVLLSLEFMASKEHDKRQF